MSLLCIQPQGGTYTFSEVTDYSQCNGYVAVPSSTLQTTMTYAEASLIVSSVLLLWTIAFSFRTLRRQMGLW